MIDRLDEINEFAKHLSNLEKEYKIKVISENGHTHASVVDLVTNNDYLYVSEEGIIIDGN